MSLEQCAQQCRAEGLPGIPRDELLRFMSDTAEALDFLADRHSLQHLDIKPANLLISGDHVKVADFGLVKELASRTQNSMVAGMTPTYSSPEMFDDAPSPHSDQYSLAIVYQEMLTGMLPFPGRTTAQLANQHLRAQPQLASLPERDRPAVGQALAKNPADRFPSCRAFVRALHATVENATARAATTQKPIEPKGISGQHTVVPSELKLQQMIKNLTPQFPASQGAKSNHSTLVRPHAAIETKSELKLPDKVPPKEDIVDVEVPKLDSEADATIPTLYIAVGGVGIRVLNLLRDSLARRAEPSQQKSAVEMIAIDTDRAEIKNACSNKWSSPLLSADTLFAPLKLPQMYREQGNSLEWLSHRWLYNIPRSLETRGYRPLGRLALVDHVEKVLALIDRKLEQLATAHADDDDRQEPPEIRIVLLVGMGGGTGGGMAVDLANAARSRLQAAGRRGQIQAVLVCTCVENPNASPLSVANTYAMLNELQFVSMFGNRGAEPESKTLQQLESPHRPFDQVYIAKVVHRENHSADEALASVVSQLVLASVDGACQAIHCCRETPTPREQTTHDAVLLRIFGSAPLVEEVNSALEKSAVDLLQCGYDRRTLILVPKDNQPAQPSRQPSRLDQPPPSFPPTWKQPQSSAKALACTPHR